MGPSRTEWQYHSRSDRHSKVACWGVFFDLLLTSGLLREHVADGRVVFGVNHAMRGFVQTSARISTWPLHAQPTVRPVGEHEP